MWYIKNLKKYQKINRPRPSKLPDARQYKNLQHAQQEFTEYSVNGHGKITEHSLNVHIEDSEDSLKERSELAKRNQLIRWRNMVAGLAILTRVTKDTCSSNKSVYTA